MKIGSRPRAGEDSALPVACERSSAAGRSEWFKVVLLACLGVAADERSERSQGGAQLLPVWHPVSGVCSRRFAPGLKRGEHRDRDHLQLAGCSRRFAPGLKRVARPGSAYPASRWLLPAFRAGPQASCSPGVGIPRIKVAAPGVSRRASSELDTGGATASGPASCSRRFAPGLKRASAGGGVREQRASVCSRRFAPGLKRGTCRSVAPWSRFHCFPGVSRRASSENAFGQHLGVQQAAPGVQRAVALLLKRSGATIIRVWPIPLAVQLRGLIEATPGLIEA